MSLPDASLRVIAAAADRGLTIDVQEFPDGTKTSVDAAAAVGCPVSAIAKSLVFEVDGAPVVALLPGDRRLDTAKLAAAMGGVRATRASLEAVRLATGFAAGGTPPFGHATDLTVLADPRLRDHEVVWAAGGTPKTVFSISPEDLVAASGADWVDLALA